MTSVVNILNFVPVTFTNAKMDSIFFLITTLLYIFGLWGIFSKCGVPGWQAVIPCLREIRLGEVSGMEKEGRIAASIQGTMIVIGIICAIVPQLLNEDFSLLVTGMRLVLALFLFIYMVRIELSLCEVFGRSKWWIVLWVAASFIPAVNGKGRNKVTFDDLELICPPDLNASVFTITDSFGSGKCDGALKTLNSLLLRKEPVPKLRATLFTHLKRLIIAKDVGNNKELAALMKFSPYYAGNLVRQSSRFDMDQLINLYFAALKSESDVRHGIYEDRIALETLIVKCSMS